MRLRKPVFGALFQCDAAVATVDILMPSGKNAWDLIKVNAVTGVYPSFLTDIPFQKQCCESAGIEVNRCFVMHLNSRFVRNGEMDAQELLIKTDVTEKVAGKSSEVREQKDRMCEIIANPNCPELDVVNECSQFSGGCPLYGECWSFLPEKDCIDALVAGSLSVDYFSKILSLIRKGIMSIHDLPDDFPLGRRASIQREAVLTQRPHVDKSAIETFLSCLSFPQYYLKLDEFTAVVPLYNMMHPFESVPFHFSLHILRSYDSEPEHIEFLATEETDPRRELIAALKESIKPEGMLVTEFGFEAGRLRKSVEAFPEYRSFVEGLISRSIGLNSLFNDFHYYHPDQQGTVSLCSLLPVLVPDFPLDNMEKGRVSINEYARVTFGDCSPQERLHDVLTVFSLVQGERGEDTASTFNYVCSAQSLVKKTVCAYATGY